MGTGVIGGCAVQIGCDFSLLTGELGTKNSGLTLAVPSVFPLAGEIGSRASLKRFTILRRWKASGS